MSRLEIEADGKVLLEEKDAITTVLVASAQICSNEQRDLVRKFVAAHAELTDWISAHPDEAQTLVRDELDAETHTKCRADSIAQRLGADCADRRCDAPSARDASWRSAAGRGFLRGAPDLARLVRDAVMPTMPTTGSTIRPQARRRGRVEVVSHARAPPCTRSTMSR